jgi:Tol biopolymer transport system component
MVRTMRRSYVGAFTALAAMVLLCMMAGSGGAAAGDTVRVSVDSSGNQADEGPQGSYRPSISNDGRYVAFESAASDLVEGDTNGGQDVFVRDRDSDADGVFDEPTHVSTKRVSVSSSGNQADGYSYNTSISADGRYVVFTSTAQNLVEGDTDGATDIFVRDRDSDADGVFDEPTHGNQAPPSISADGRYVAFTSRASGLVEGDADTNNTYDVFVHDRTTGTTEWVSRNQANGFDGTMSDNGDYVVYLSSGSSSGASLGVFVRDLSVGTSERASVNSSGVAADDPSDWPTISADGRYVAFRSDATNLVIGDTNGVPDVFVRDRTAQTTQRVNIDACGAQASSGDWTHPTISPDGRYVAFTSAFPNHGGGTYVRNLQAQTTQRTSGGGYGSLSNQARYIAFDSTAPYLVADDTNGKSDVFVQERQTNATQPSECIPPTTTASATTSSGPYQEGRYTTKDVKVTLGAQDNEGGSGVNKLTYYATGAQQIPSATVSAGQLPKVLPLIDTEGTTTINAFATDNAGNPGPMKSLTVMIDKSEPDTEIVSGPSGYVKSTSAEFWLSKAGSEDGYVVSFQCSLDNSSFIGCPQHSSYSNLGQGRHTFQGRTVDKAGNVDTSPPSRSWFVDTVVPKGTISINGGNASTSKRLVTLTLSARDPSPASGVAKMRFRNEDTTTWSSWFDYATSKSWTLSSGAGTKTVYVKYRDLAGNISAAASDTIKFSPS